MADDTMKNIKNIDKVISTFISSIFILAFVGFVALIYLIPTQISSSEKITSQIAQQLAYNVHNNIFSDLQILDSITKSEYFKEGKFNPNLLKEILSSKNNNATFQSISYITLEGIAYTATRDFESMQTSNVSKNACFLKAKSGNVCFDREKDETQGISVYKNTYAMPIILNGKVTAVLSGQTRTDMFKTILDFSSFNNMALSHIIKSNGDYVLRSEHKSVQNSENFFKQKGMFLSKKSDSIKTNLQNRKSGIFWSVFDNQLWVGAYSSILFDNWSVLLFIPAKVLTLNIVKVLLISIGMMLAINCFLFLVLKRVESLQNKLYDKMMKLAFSDEVTGGSNKAKFIIDAQNLFKNALGSDKYAIILMDITKFKVINELYGFDAANVILKDIYEIIKKHLPEGSLLTRSFAASYLFIMKYSNDSEINELVDRIHKSIDFYNDENVLAFKKSLTNKVVTKIVPQFGVYLVNDFTVPIYIMCDRVSLAKRTISGDVNKYISYYDDNLRKQLLDEKNIEDEMHQALESKQFVMFLQPKFDMKTLKIVGSEALVRWIHPTRGFIPPCDFIPLFERNGFILNLDRYIWEQACSTIRKWMDEGKTPVPISVNVSRLHLNNDIFIEDLKDMVKKYDIPTSMIELELTESAGYEDFPQFLKILHELKKCGFCIAMDDFGSGYSSLNMLRQIPCDILKLDRGFINDTTYNERGKIVVQSVLSMAKNLDLKTVSEGIETVEQANFLNESGCDIAQGFLYAKPMCLADFERLAFSNEKLVIEGLAL
ncbi:MAG: EAL domain-containing protein [Candidatus Gastranaerophilaceae bacterium]